MDGPSDVERYAIEHELEHWRAAARYVRWTYDRWDHAMTRDGRDRAYDAYSDALKAEERAAETYQFALRVT